MFDTQHNDCVDFFPSAAASSLGPLDELRACARQLPFDDEARKVLIRRHSLPALLNFCREHATALQTAVLLLCLGSCDASNNPPRHGVPYTVPHTGGLQKTPRLIGGHAYCLLDAQDRSWVWGLETWQQEALWRQFGGNAFFRIMRHNTGQEEAGEAMQVEVKSRKRASSGALGGGGELALYDASNRPQKRERHQALVVARQQREDLNLQLALAQQEQQNRDEKHALELELLKTRHALELASKDNEVLGAKLALEQARAQCTAVPRLLVTNGHQTTLSPMTGAVRRAPINCINDWLKNTLYPKQDLSRLSLPTQWRFKDLFDEKLVRYQDLVASLQVVPCGASLLLAVPLTYRYRLADVLRCLAASPTCGFVAQDFAFLLERCPSRYTMLLYYCDDVMSNPTQALTNPLNRFNVATLLLHCQAIVQVALINAKAERALSKAREKAKTGGGDGGSGGAKKLQDVKEKEVEKISLIAMPDAAKNKPAELVPSLELLDEYYPAPCFYGPDTYVTWSMGLRVQNPVFERVDTYSLGIGSGKCCPLCWTNDRIVAPTACDVQHSHHFATCPVLAYMSQNEAVVLLALRQAFDSRLPGNKERAEKMRKNVTTGRISLYHKDFKLNDATLLRHASDEELATGQHVAGLRLNMPVYLDLRKATYASLQVQQRLSPLMGALEARVVFLAQLLLAPPLDARSTVMQLLQFADGTPFKPVKATRTFDAQAGDTDGMFFSLQPTQPGPREQAHLKFVQDEAQKQQYAAQYAQMMAQMALMQQQQQHSPGPQDVIEEVYYMYNEPQ